jgi:non-ribosomal peptide synthetase component F
MALGKGLLPGDSLPALRQVFLGGEAVPLGVARAMCHAAPGAFLVNLYGPTEGTVAITHFPIDLNQPIPDLVPIGAPFDD